MFRKSKIKYDHDHLIHEQLRLEQHWINTNAEAIVLMLYFYDILCKTKIRYYKPYSSGFEYSCQLTHLGQAKFFFMNKDYISAACEIFGRYMQYECVGVIDNVKSLIETELLSNEIIFPKKEKTQINLDRNNS